LTLLVGRQEGHPACKKTEWWGAGMVICLERGADLHTALLMPLPLAVSCFSKIQVVLPFWYRLTRVVPDKGPLNGCMYTASLNVLLSEHSSCVYQFGKPGLIFNSLCRNNDVMRVYLPSVP